MRKPQLSITPDGTVNHGRYKGLHRDVVRLIARRHRLAATVPGGAAFADAQRDEDIAAAHLLRSAGLV